MFFCRAKKLEKKLNIRYECIERCDRSITVSTQSATEIKEEEITTNLPQKPDQTPRFSMQDVENASIEYFNGDSLAGTVFSTKYALRNNNIISLKDGDEPKQFVELTPDAMHDRLAYEFAKQDEKYKNPISFETFRKALDRFQYIVPQGSPMYGVGNPFVKVSISNCVVVDYPKDNMSGIMESGKDLANLFKRRCGVGLSLDTLRPDGTAVSNSAGTSTGAWSFANYFSEVCRMIGQNGRRGALMITMNVLHPDIPQFTVMKRDKSRVTGANVSIMLTDEFMHAVENDEDWICRWPLDVNVDSVLEKGGEWQQYDAAEHLNRPIACKKWIPSTPNKNDVLVSYRATELWHLINESAVTCAEPGLLFWDNYGNNLPAHSYEEFKLVCVNPCAEIGLSPYDSCRLTSLNLKGYVLNPYTPEARFDYETFNTMTRLGMRIMDDIVDIEIDCLTKIIDSCDEPEEKVLWNKLRNAAERGRRTGLGMHGLADALACLNLRYDSDAALAEVDKISEAFCVSAYDASVDLAIERGVFPAFDWNTEKDCAFIKRLPDWLQEKMSKHGRRNISLLTIAPTGSVSIVSQTSSGLEPVFSNFYTRRRKINPSDVGTRVDFIDQNGDKWQEYPVFHNNVQQYLIATNKMEEWKRIEETIPAKNWAEEFQKILPEWFVTAPEIDAKRRVEIQGHIQRWIDHGISSTINMPKGTTIEQGQELYMLAWKHGLKGVTIYVDGSRSGVLVNFGESKDPTTEIVESKCPKRPKELPCDIHHIKVDGTDWVAFVGLLNGVPYEIFGGAKEQVDIPKKIKKGKITKRKCEKVNAKGRTACYDLIIGEDDDEWKIKDVAVSFENGNYAAQTRMISLSLRHGVPAQFIAEQLSRDLESDFHSFSRVMARVLKQYVVDGATGSEKCPNCGDKLRFENGCTICPNCGEGKCS